MKGGTAGCVIASRVSRTFHNVISALKSSVQLTEDPDVSVLVVEAGESDAKQIYSRIPAAWVRT